MALHAYTGSDGHDYVWASGYSNVNAYNVLELSNGATSWVDSNYYQSARTGTGYYQVGAFGSGWYDGPGYSSTARIYFNSPTDGWTPNFISTASN